MQNRFNQHQWRKPLLSFVYSLLGFVFAISLWHITTALVFAADSRVQPFTPYNTFTRLGELIRTHEIFPHILASLKRVGVGLGYAIIIGIPVGLAVGRWGTFSSSTYAVFQFLRMTSPIAWTTIAIMFFGVGDRPAYFLVAIASVWPLIINVSSGFRNIDPVWIRVVQMLGGNSFTVMRRAIIPALIPDMLTGIRLAIGIAWIVLVPAEMIGASAGLGYHIFETRDNSDSSGVLATILVIGCIGFLTDMAVAWLQRRLAWRGRIAS